MLGVPPNTLQLVYIHRDILFIFGYYYITTCHSKQLPVGLIVLSEDGPLSEDQENFNKSTKLSCWL